METCSNKYNKYIVRNGLIYYKRKIALPSKSTLIYKIITKLQSTPIGGHEGICRTLARATTQSFWLKMKEDIKYFIQTCLKCQQVKYDSKKQLNYYKSEEIIIDFIIGQPKSNGSMSFLL